MRKKLDQLKPEDAIPLLVRLKTLILGRNKPDGFTRLMFTFSLFSWLLLTIWNAVSYFVLLTSDIIEENKGFSVKDVRSEEHTSELQSRPHLVCRLLLEKKKKNY